MSMTPSTFLPKRDKNATYIAEVQSIPLSPSAYSVIIKDKSIFETSLSPNGSVSMSSYLISKLSAKYEKTKTENAVRVRLSICRDLYDTLSSDDLYYENKVYSSTLRRFLKAVYEDYALLSDCERERLIFADNIIKINEIIKQNGSRY